MTKPNTKSKTQPRKPTYINLDPTNDPEKVCEAYRQIAIKSKLKASLSHKRHFDAQREENKIVVAKSKAKSISIKQTKAIRYQNNILTHNATKRRTDIRNRLIAGGYKSNPEKANECKTAREDIEVLRADGLDIVAINTSGSSVTADKAVSIWAIDNLKRVKGIISGTNTTNYAAIVLLLRPIFEEGYLISLSNSDGSKFSVTQAITLMRKAGMPICSVKNSRRETVLRGWVLPSVANGLASVDDTQI